MDRLVNDHYTMNCHGELMTFDTPKVMGILNVTPDSFYDGGRYIQEQAIYGRVKQIMNERADFVDVGGASTRPGSSLMEPREEWKRIEPALRMIRDYFPNARISVDTYSAYVAQKAVEEYGVCMINDVSAGAFDDKMFDTMAALQVPYVMMHMKGTPETMQQNPEYEDMVREIFTFFARRVNQLRERGLKDIILDPGFGFGKKMEHNYQLLEKLDAFRIFECPLLAGISRKSMVYKVLGINAGEALNGSTVLNTIALLKGVHLLRVHDVKAAQEVVTLTAAYKASTS